MSHVAKKHHYVPQFILREFSHSGTQVQVFDKSNDKQFLSSVINAGHQNGFYSWDEEVAGEKIRISLEPVLAGIDGAGSNVIQKIIHNQSLAKLSDQEINDLFHFITVQMIRGNAARDWVEGFTGIIGDKVRRMGFDPHTMPG